jgi:hypothetical protein
MRIAAQALVALTALALTAPAAAQDAEPKNKAGKVAAADKRNEKEDDPSKFFWFHKTGIDADTAKADIEYCLAQTSTIQAKQNPSSGQGGLIGALVEGIIHSIVENVERRRMHDAGMRKCMGLYGYQRFHVPEPKWNAMMRAPDAVDQLTIFASGSAPTTERLPQ